VFVAQGVPTGLNKAVTDAAGNVSFSPEGPVSAVSYNAIGYNTANNYLYGIVTAGNAALPTSSLIRIGEGGVITRVGTQTYGINANVGAFGGDGLFYITTSGSNTLTAINVSTGAVARTVTLSQASQVSDFTFANGYFWGHSTSGGASQIARINPASGAVTFYPAPFFLNGATDVSGANWTYGNGNLGFSQNSSGTVTQIAVTNPGSATPTFTVVSRTTGPGSGNNDGAASPGQPTDLAIEKTGPAVLLPAGGPVEYTLTVTNNGPGNSSGYSVRDAVPAPLTGAASSTPGCTVAGADVVCTGGRLVAGDSTTITITANAPANVTSAVTNTARVTANEQDPNTANNTSSTTANPASVSFVKHAGTPVDANSDGIVDAGDTIEYTFTVTNTGLVALNDVAVDDPKIGAVTCPAGALAPGATVTCTADAAYTITADDETAGGVDNSATATATPEGTSTPITSAPSTTHTPTTAPAPNLSVVKSASPSDAAAYTVGQAITYSFVVTNTGNVPISDIAIDEASFSGSDPMGAITCPAGTDTLAPNEQVICTADYTLTQADVDALSLTNSATATGTPPGGEKITTPPSEVTIPVAPAPAISLVKSVSPAKPTKSGETLNYSFAVTNTGNVTVQSAAITELAFSGTGPVPVASCPADPFIPGQTVTCTAEYELTQADVDAGTVTNTAAASADGPATLDPVSGPSSAAVTIEAAPALTVVKSGSVAGSGVAGEVITYSFLVTNTGNVTVSDIAVEEGEFSGTGTLGAVTCPDPTLAPTGTTTCTAEYTLTQADVDAGEVTNSATATGTPPGGGKITTPPSETTVDTDRTPELTLVKSANPQAVTKAGDTVEYSFLVTNTGTVTLTDPVIEEAAFSGSAGPLEVSCPAGTTLAPNDPVTCTASYVITQDDVDAGEVTNTATATATPPAGVDVPVSEPSTATVTAAAAPGLELVKSADVTTVTAAGQRIVYSFLVTNTGNVSMSNIEIADDDFTGTGVLPPAVCPERSLAPGDAQTCTSTYTVTQADVDAGTLQNTASATGTPPGSETPIPSEPSTTTVAVEQEPGLTVVKSASPNAPVDFRAGETITYSFVVTNTGNVTLTDVSVVEGEFTGSGTLEAPICPAGAASLAPGDQVVCSTEYTVTQADIDAGEITNTATAEGTPPGSGEKVPSEPSTVIVPQPANPAATVVKTADVQKVTKAGQLVTYSFTVTNTGNTSLSDPVINEGRFTGRGKLTAPVCPAEPAELLPGQTIVCTASYVVVAADLTGEPLENTATVTVTPPGGDPVTSEPSTAKITEVAVPPASNDPLATTGTTIAWGLGIAAIGLFGVGGILMIRRRRLAE